MAKAEKSPKKAVSKATEKEVDKKVNGECETPETPEIPETPENGGDSSASSQENGDGDDVVIQAPVEGYYQINKTLLDSYLYGNISGDDIIQKKKGGPFISSRTGETFIPASLLGELILP